MARTYPLTAESIGSRLSVPAPFWLASFLPGFDPTQEVLIVRVSTKDEHGHIVSNYTANHKRHNFYWPRKGTISFVGKFDPTDTCGDGLHGCLLAKPSTFNALVTPNANAVLQLLRVKREDAFMVYASGEKVKFSKGEVVLTTNSKVDINAVANAVYGVNVANSIGIPVSRFAKTV